MLKEGKSNEKSVEDYCNIFVVAAFVSAAGCAGKSKTTANRTQGASEQVTSAIVSTKSVVTPAEANNASK